MVAYHLLLSRWSWCTHEMQLKDGSNAVPFYQTLLGAPGRAVGGGRHYFDCGGVIVR